MSLTPEFDLSTHARDMLGERGIPEEWVRRAVYSPDRAEIGPDDNTHYIKAFPEFGGRISRVVVSGQRRPNRVVTFFFDRRLRTQP